MHDHKKMAPAEGRGVMGGIKYFMWFGLIQLECQFICINMCTQLEEHCDLILRIQQGGSLVEEKIDLFW